MGGDQPHHHGRERQPKARRSRIGEPLRDDPRARDHQRDVHRRQNAGIERNRGIHDHPAAEDERDIDRGKKEEEQGERTVACPALTGARAEQPSA